MTTMPFYKKRNAYQRKGSHFAKHFPGAAFFACAVFLTALAGCDQKKETNDSSSDVTTTVPVSAGPTLKSSTEIATALSQATTSALAANLNAASELQSKIQVLLNEPSPSHLKAAQAAWLEGVLSYRSANFQKHIALVDPKNFARINRLDYQIASFPIQPGFIDSFGPYKYSGLVHDIGFPITRESLEGQHGLTDLADVILGYYAIEFLLFNVDGERELGDFVAIDTINDELKKRGFEKLSEIPNNRRRALLTQQARILVANTEELIGEWQVIQGAPILIKALPQDQAEDLMYKAVASAITQLLIELSGFTAEESENEIISARISNADFSTQKLFIHNAIKSLTSVNTLLLSEGESKFDLKALLEAEALTGEESPENVEDTKAFWAEVFAKLKQASDSIPI